MQGKVRVSSFYCEFCSIWAVTCKRQCHGHTGFKEENKVHIFTCARSAVCEEALNEKQPRHNGVYLFLRDICRSAILPAISLVLSRMNSAKDNISVTSVYMR